MRVRHAPYLVAPCVVFLGLGCGDDLPTYPPVINVYVGTNSGGSGTNVGPGPVTGNGNSGGSGNTAGSSNNAGGDDAGGAGTTNPTGGSAGTGVNDLFPHCSEMWSEDLPPPKKACDLDKLQDGGVLTGDITADKSLETGHSYTLQGSVRVMPGVTLTIPPCVKIVGADSTSLLAIRAGDLGDPFAACTYSGNKKPGPGAKLIAVGEPNAPIVFTSAKEPGKRRPGDWGGLMLMGNAHNNKASPGYRVIVEGLTKSECFGWHTTEFDQESSGDIEYVRVEYASRQIAADNETNNVTLAGIGHGTIFSHVESSNSGDDCFEWFGGTMDADHLIALNCDDDMFDTDDGFSGHVQFAFGRQWPTTTETDSSGFESDTGLTNGQPFTPPTTAEFSNFAICGAGPTDVAPLTRPGAAFRAGSQQVMWNGLITQFGAGGVRVVTLAQPVGHSLRVWDNPASSPLLFDATSTLQMNGLDPTPPDRFCGCFTDPPSPIGATAPVGDAPDFGDKTAKYIGAFADSKPASNWMRGKWVDWASE